MGFYVNLEMPKDCPMCPFGHYDMFNTFCGCDITRGKRQAVKNDKDYAESSTRPDWCPLVEVPEPHGRLIDADAALKNIKPINPKDQWIGCTIETTKRLMMSLINRAPTVIPESEDEIDEAQRDYQAAADYQQYCETYEQTYDPETGAM